MSGLSDGCAFQSELYFQPAGSTLKNAQKKPFIEAPQWIIKRSSHYLASWIGAIFEESLWAHFNYANDVNIGNGVDKTKLHKIFERRDQNLQSQDDLVDRWNVLG